MYQTDEQYQECKTQRLKFKQTVTEAKKNVPKKNLV